MKEILFHYLELARVSDILMKFSNGILMEFNKNPVHETFLSHSCFFFQVFCIITLFYVVHAQISLLTKHTETLGSSH